MLMIAESHPVQYHAPVYRFLSAKLHVPLTVVYGSDFSVAGYRDHEFGARFAWDADLLSGYPSRFLSRTSETGECSYERVRARGLRGLMEELRPSAVLICGYASVFDRQAIGTAMRAKIPILLRGEMSDRAVSQTPWARWARDAALGWLYPRCHRLLYTGTRALEHYRRLGVPESKLVHSPYCVDASSFRSEEKDRDDLRGKLRQKWGISPRGKVLLYCGKLSERKGIVTLLDAARRWPRSGAPEALVLVGDGQRRRDVEWEADVCSRPRIILEGFQNQSRLSDYYHAADALALPSVRGETWGLVVNEALHHGLPCVVSDRVGCAPDLIETAVTGYVFRSGDTQDFIRAAESCLSMTSDRKFRDNLRAHVERAGVEPAARGIERAWRETCGSSRSRPQKLPEQAKGSG